MRRGPVRAFPDVASYLASVQDTPTRGADVVIEATTSPDGPRHATEAVRIGGKVVMVGIPDGDQFTLQASLVRRKGLTIKLLRRMGHIYPRAIEFVRKGVMTVQHARHDLLLPPVLNQVRIQDAFWSPRLEANRACTLPALWHQLEKVGATESYDLSAYAKRGVVIPKNHDVTPQMWWDSDIAKFIEAASASLLLHPDPELDARMDKVIAQMATAQQDDGYLNTYFTAIEPDRKFTNERDWHELYNAGHLIEAAVTHHQATGKTSLLDILEKYVDKLMTVYGPKEGQKHGYPGHEEIELALIRLYHATGKEKYLDFARYFLNERGVEPNFFELEARERGDDPKDFWANT